MKPYDNTPKQEFTCTNCGAKFLAKRQAKFCCDLCQNRSRPPRPKPTTEQQKAWRAARLQNPGYRERVNSIANTRAVAIREWISKCKADVGCVDCGFKDPRALDFDHLDGTTKAINVSNAKSIEQAKQEIAKCVVRCANCHRIVTHQRLQQARK